MIGILLGGALQKTRAHLASKKSVGLQSSDKQFSAVLISQNAA